VLGEVSVTNEPFAMRWDAGGFAPPYACVLLAGDYRELVRADGIDEPRWRPPPEVLHELESGSTYHCYVLAGRGTAAVRSPLVTFTRR
jgi:hypothetical protein